MCDHHFIILSRETKKVLAPDISEKQNLAISGTTLKKENLLLNLFPSQGARLLILEPIDIEIFERCRRRPPRRRSFQIVARGKSVFLFLLRCKNVYVRTITGDISLLSASAKVDAKSGLLLSPLPPRGCYNPNFMAQFSRRSNSCTHTSLHSSRLQRSKKICLSAFFSVFSLKRRTPIKSFDALKNGS